MISDNATRFLSESLVTFMEENRMKWKTILAYAPMSTGMAERMVGTLKQALGKMVLAHRASWDDELPIVSYGYRRRHLTCRISFSELLYGLKPRMTPEETRVIEKSTCF